MDRGEMGEASEDRQGPDSNAPHVHGVELNAAQTGLTALAQNHMDRVVVDELLATLNEKNGVRR